MRVAIYCRVSTRDQTLEQQKEPLIKYCQDNQLDYDIYEDKISGAKDSRPQLDLMMQEIRSRKYSKVMVYKLDRLGRSLKHLIQLIEEFNNKDVHFICFNPTVDTKSASGRLLIQIMGSIAEFERELTRERTILKLDYLKNVEGIKLGRPAGSKDKRRRKKSGYYLRHAKKATPQKVDSIQTQELHNISTTN